MTAEPQCDRCVHFQERALGPLTCEAFPDKDGIPAEIIKNVFDHRKPYPGDNGIRFEARRDALAFRAKA